MIDVINLKEMPECPNCTPLNPTICFILPDRDITKIAETILVSAICLILPFGFVTPERLELSTR